jgi:hypothetical protein
MLGPEPILVPHGQPEVVMVRSHLLNALLESHLDRKLLDVTGLPVQTPSAV